MIHFTFGLLRWLGIQRFGIFLLDICALLVSSGSERAWGQKAGMEAMTAENMLCYEGSCRPLWVLSGGF